MGLKGRCMIMNTFRICLEANNNQNYFLIKIFHLPDHRVIIFQYNQNLIFLQFQNYCHRLNFQDNRHHTYSTLRIYHKALHCTTDSNIWRCLTKNWMDCNKMIINSIILWKHFTDQTYSLFFISFSWIFSLNEFCYVAKLFQIYCKISANFLLFFFK